MSITLQTWHQMSLNLCLCSINILENKKITIVFLCMSLHRRFLWNLFVSPYTWLNPIHTNTSDKFYLRKEIDKHVDVDFIGPTKKQENFSLIK